MTDLFFLPCVGTAGLITFIIGLLIGNSTKSKRTHRVILNQNEGEGLVRKLLTTDFPPPNFHLLNHITIPFENGTTQIDHILISTKGIFVIETKYFSGWIFGSENSKEWTQSLPRTKNKFQNPIKQNYKHIIAVQNLLDFLPKEQIHSIVVFSGDAEFKSTKPNGVLYLDQLSEYIKNFKNDVISSNQLEHCVGRIECKRYEITKRTDIQHQAYLAKKFGDAP